MRNNTPLRFHCLNWLLSLSLLPFSQLVLAAELTRDQNDACSAILCLSSAVGRDLNECRTTLKRYFSINARILSDTLTQRKRFLGLCPLTEWQDKDSYIQTLVEGAGQCDAASLNQNLKESIRFESCRRRGDSEICTPFYKYRISNQLSSQCQALFKSQYTDFTVNYQGTSSWQTAKQFAQQPTGLWVEKNR